MIGRTLALAVAAALALAPLAGAHDPPGPEYRAQDCTHYDDNLDGAAYYHDYVLIGAVQTPLDVQPVTIDPADYGDGNNDSFYGGLIFDNSLTSCDPNAPPDAHLDGEWSFGVGTVFLNSKHHGGDVCIDDAALGPDAEFVVTSDTDNDGFADEEQPAATDCTTITIPDGWGTPSKSTDKHDEYGTQFAGLQRGWWVFIKTGTAGHVWTTDCTSDSTSTCWFPPAGVA